MQSMVTSEAARLLLFSDGQRHEAPSTVTKIRRYRLARLRLDTARAEGEPRYAYLKRAHD